MEGEGEPPALIPFPTPRIFGCARSAYSQSRVNFQLTRLCWVIRKRGRTFAKSLFLFLSMAHKWLNILLCLSFTPSVYHRYWKKFNMTNGRIDTFKGIRILWFLFSLRNPDSLAWNQAPLRRKIDKGVKRHQILACEGSRAEYSLRNPKFHQRLKSDSKTHWQRIWNPVPGIWNP